MSWLDPPPDNTRALKWTIGLTLAALVLGVWGCWDKLSREHARLDPWQIALVWLGNAMALAWFLYVANLVFVRGADARAIAAKGKPTGKLVLISMATALGIDLGATLFVSSQERAAFDRAVPAKGQLHAFENRGTLQEPRVELRYTFHDAAGSLHAATIEIYPRGGFFFPEFLSKQQQLALMAKAFPVDFEVKYDPRQPLRNWPRGITWEETTIRWLFVLSKVAAFVQGFLLLGFAMTLHQDRFSDERTRRNLESINVFGPLIPLAAEALILAIFAAQELR